MLQFGTYVFPERFEYCRFTRQSAQVAAGVPSYNERLCGFDKTKTSRCNNNPANTICWPNAELMLAQRRRRWANISPALGQRVVSVDKW